MRYIDLTYNSDARTLTVSDSLAGTTVDDLSTSFRLDSATLLKDADIDIVYGVLLRSKTHSSVGYSFSRFEKDEDTVAIPQDVLKACRGGSLPIYLRITYDADGSIEASLPLSLHVANLPDPVESVHAGGDLVMLRMSSWEWRRELTYAKGAVVTHGNSIYISQIDGNKGNEPDTESSEFWGNVSSSGLTPTVLESLKGLNENVQDALDNIRESGESLSGRVDDLEDVTDVLTTDLESLSTDLETVDGDVQNLKVVVPALEGSVGSIGTEVAGIKEKAVTLDDPQTITGTKTISTSIIYPENAKGGYNPITVRLAGTNNRYLSWRNNDLAGDKVIFQIDRLYDTLELTNNPVKSTDAVNLRYVESTDGVTNNLVHRSAEETIGGLKSFSSQTSRINSALAENRGTYPEYTVENVMVQSSPSPTSPVQAHLRQYDTSVSREISIRQFSPYSMSWIGLGVISNSVFGNYGSAPTPSDTAPADAIVTKGYAKMVTTDTEQTLSAQKIIRRGGEPKIVLADTRGKAAITPSTTYYNDIRFADTDSATQGQIRFAHRNSGAKSYTLRLVAENGTVVNTEIFGVSKTGEPYSFVPTPSANANSSSAVNIAYISATDGTTNNLVHILGDESVDGVKTHLKMIPVLPVAVTGNTGWRKVYERYNPQSVTNTFIIEIIAGGEQYAMIEWKCKANTEPSGHYLIKSQDWSATVKLTRDTGNNFLVWINDNRHTALYRMGRVSNKSTLTVVPEIPEDYETIYGEPTTSTYAHVTVIQ